MSQGKRIDWIDTAKGIGIIAVIIGHFHVPDLTMRLIYSWHMPLFFIISGILYTDKPFSELLKAKSNSLIRPYLYTCFAVIILGCIKYNLQNIEINTAFVYWITAGLYGSGLSHLILSLHLPQIGAVWFLLALFWAFLSLHFCLKFKYPIIPAIGLFILGYSTRELWLPLSIQAGMAATLYLQIGFVIREKKLLSKLLNPSALLFCSMIWLSGISFGFGWLDLVRNYFRYGVWDFLFSLSAVVVILNLSHIVNKIPFIAPPVRFVGKNSLKFLCFHTLELNLFPWEVFIHGSYANEIIFLMKITYISASTLILNNYNRLKCSMIKFQS